MPDGTKTIVVHSSELAAFANEASAPAGPAGGDLTDELLRTATWTDDMVRRAGIPVRDVPFVTIGGGIGSFVMADHLRVAGVPVESIATVSNIDKPMQTYEYLTRVSQIPRQEVLRSDSTGCPDSVWAWPSYAYRAAWTDKTLAPVFSVTVEPVFTDYWTPKAGQVFEAITKEAQRIGFERTLVKANARMVRKRDGGGYFVVATPPPGSSPTKRIALRCKWVHIAVGYPGLRFLPDLQEYRQKYNDFNRVVNAYEPHEGVYEALRARPGLVLVRGGGIVASRILQRLMEDRWNHNAQTTVLHLFRTYTEGTQDRGGKFYRRKGGDGWSYQGFNWPKGAWGGQIKDKFDTLEGEERKALYLKLGGTHTPKRKLWQEQLKRARSEGWYSTQQGEVTEVVKDPTTGRVVTRVKSKNGASSEIQADYVIDATGLEADISEHRLLEDLLTYSGVGRNVMGRLDVERDFEIRGARSGEGRMYASGAITLGAYYAGVDSFLGLQYAALRITDDLSTQGFGSYIGVGRSVSQWWKWARGKTI